MHCDKRTPLDVNRVSRHLELEGGSQPEWRFAYYKVEEGEELLHIGQRVYLDATEFGGPVVDGWVKSTVNHRDGRLVEQTVTVVGYDEDAR